MANPRYISKQGEPTVELLQRLVRAKETYFSNLEKFCELHHIHPDEMKKVDEVYLIGSHATESDWHNETSDIDFKLVIPDALPMDLFRYKREVLDPLLCPKDQEKFRWIDLFFCQRKLPSFESSF
jgi:predicted nucleotidyltransferase